MKTRFPISIAALTLAAGVVLWTTAQASAHRWHRGWAPYYGYSNSYYPISDMGTGLRIHAGLCGFACNSCIFGELRQSPVSVLPAAHGISSVLFRGVVTSRDTKHAAVTIAIFARFVRPSRVFRRQGPESARRRIKPPIAHPEGKPRRPLR